FEISTLSIGQIFNTDVGCVVHFQPAELNLSLAYNANPEGVLFSFRRRPIQNVQMLLDRAFSERSQTGLLFFGRGILEPFLDPVPLLDQTVSNPIRYFLIHIFNPMALDNTKQL